METPNQHDSCVFLTNKLKNQEPFVFVKFGDGDLYWMRGHDVAIAGGETYRRGIDKELRGAARTLAELPHVFFGDQLTCGSGPYLELEQELFIGLQSREGVGRHRWLHFECLLIHRLSPELLGFYKALQDDERVKVFLGGPHLAGTASMLGARIVITADSQNAHVQTDFCTTFLREQFSNWDILLLSAGRASKMIAAALAEAFPAKTIIELGSALDPLFVGRTRSEQVEPEQARIYFRELYT